MLITPLLAAHFKGQFIDLNPNYSIPAQRQVADDCPFTTCVVRVRSMTWSRVVWLAVGMGQRWRVRGWVLQQVSGSSMEVRLSANGVDKLMGSVTGMVVQLVSLEAKFQNNQCYYACEVSDGFCRAKGCVLENNQQTEREQLAENAVVRVTKSAVQKNKKQRNVIIVEGYDLLLNPLLPVGKPIPYDDYIRNGKDNPQGDNLVPAQKPKPDRPAAKTESRPAQNPQRSYSSCSEDSRTNDENSRVNKQPPKPLPPNHPPNHNSNTNSRLPPPTPPPQQRTLSLPKEESRAVSREVKAKGGPIERLPGRKEQRGSQSHRQRKPQSEYNEIRSLHVGMENWVILGRIISISPLRSFISKKGAESSLLSFDIGDRSGVIECTVYGEPAQRYSGTLKEDQIYEIANGFVSESSYLGQHRLKVTVGDNSRVSLKEDDPNVPYMEDFCLTVKKLTEAAVGEEVRVICLVKDEGETESLASREGKPLLKKTVVLCDPVDRVEVDVTLWNEGCSMRFECYPYLIKGVQVKEYQGARQYSLRANSRATVLKQHPLRKFIKDLTVIPFTNPDSARKTSRRPAISCLADLNNAMDEVSAGGTWSQAVCFIAAVKQAGKNYYIGCPKCKKKVADVEGMACVHCNHNYPQAQYRYVLSLNVADYTDSAWVNAYDEAGEALLGIPAQQYAAMKEEEVQEHVRKVRYRHKKLRMVTKNEDFNGTTRKKTTIIKVVDLNFAEETKILLEKVTHLLAK